jgi:hypothetical protein
MATATTHREVLLKPTVAVLYSDAGAAALIDALKRWRTDYAPQAAYDALFAEYIRECEVKNSIRPGGQATIVVHVLGRRKRDNDIYYYEASVAGGELKLNSIFD